MTIRRGEQWGRPAPLASDSPIAASDAALRAIVAAARTNGQSVPIGLTGGDLCRTVGGTGSIERLHSDEAAHLPIDLVIAHLDGREHVFVSHLVARNRGWQGRFAIAMNAQFIGSWNMAQRGHPNDGRIDLTQGHLSLSDRLKARSRLPLGTHIPHPDLATSQTSSVQISFERAKTVWLDGEIVGRAHELSIRVEPDAFTVVV